MVWSLGVLGAGVASTATLMGVTGSVAEWVYRSWTIWDWVIDSAVLVGPFAVSAVGLWLIPRRSIGRLIIRFLAALVVLGAIPGVCLAVSAELEFRRRGVPLGILGYLGVAFLALGPQYFFASLAFLVGWIGRREAEHRP